MISPVYSGDVPYRCVMGRPALDGLSGRRERNVQVLDNAAARRVRAGFGVLMQHSAGGAVAACPQGCLTGSYRSAPGVGA